MFTSTLSQATEGGENMRAKNRSTRVWVGATVFILIAAILLLFRFFRYVVEQWT